MTNCTNGATDAANVRHACCANGDLPNTVPKKTCGDNHDVMTDDKKTHAPQRARAFFGTGLFRIARQIVCQDLPSAQFQSLISGMSSPYW